LSGGASTRRGATGAANRVEDAFARLRADRRKGLMPFVCGGYPTVESTAGAIGALARAGASVIEVGIPFSDPIADGPTIAAAMHEALVAGVTPRDVMSAVERARSGGDGAGVGVVAMVSVSIVGRIGAKRFVADARSAGFDGFIFPDAPLEESEDLIGLSREAGLVTSLLVAPTTDPERAARIARACTGFVYLMARVGITGDAPGAAVDTAGIRKRVDELRGATDLPIACGFGISTPEHVSAVVSDSAGGADAAIVGSALVKRMGRAAAEGRDPVEAAESFALRLAAGLG